MHIFANDSRLFQSFCFNGSERESSFDKTGEHICCCLYLNESKRHRFLENYAVLQPGISRNKLQDQSFIHKFVNAKSEPNVNRGNILVSEFLPEASVKKMNFH